MLKVSRVVMKQKINFPVLINQNAVFILTDTFVGECKDWSWNWIMLFYRLMFQQRIVRDSRELKWLEFWWRGTSTRRGWWNFKKLWDGPKWSGNCRTLITVTVKPDVLFHATLQTSAAMLVFWLAVCSEQFATGSYNLLATVANLLA